MSASLSPAVLGGGCYREDSYHWYPAAFPGDGGVVHKDSRRLPGFGVGLVTGNADGIDGIARDVWSERYSDRVTLVLPWPDYNRDKVRSGNHVVVYQGQREWLDSVVRYHPPGAFLKPGAVALHARNYGIVELADVVIAFPNDGKEGGGTGQGIRIARALGRELFILPGDLDRLRGFYASHRPLT